MYSRIRPTFHLALIALVFALAGLGCGGSGGGPGPGGDDCTTLLATARGALEDEIYRLDHADSVRHPTDIDFRAAEAAYGNAIASCPDEGEAIFGGALSSFLVVTQDPQVVATFDRWQAFIDTASIFKHDVPVTARAVPGLGGAPFRLGSPSPDPRGIVRAMVTLPFMALTDPPQVEELQDLVENEVLPRLGTGTTQLGDVASDPAFRFTVTPKMQGDLAADPLELDLTEVQAMLASTHVLSAFANLVTAYSLNVATYDSLGMLAALQQDSEFLSLRTGGAARMAAVRTNLLTAADHIEDGIDALEAEVDSQDDDIIVIDDAGGHDGPTHADLDSIRTTLDEIRGALNGPYDVTEDFDGDGIDETVTMDLEAFLTNPPDNLKALLPPYTVEVIGRSEASGHAADMSEDLCPVITWEADSFDEWIFPDPTLGGLLPGMTDADLKDLMGLTSDEWRKVNELCDVLQLVIVEGLVHAELSGDPILDAVVTTSLDGTYQGVDENGYFNLVTTTRGDYCCTPFTITVTASGYDDWSVTQIWGQHATSIDVSMHQTVAARSASR